MCEKYFASFYEDTVSECSGNQYQWSRAAEAWLMQHKNIILYPVEAAACHSHNELFPVRCPAIKIIFLIPTKIYVWRARGQSPASHYNNSNRMILLLNSAKFASVAPSKYIVKNISTKNIPYGHSSARLPDIQLSFRHLVI